MRAILGLLCGVGLAFATQAQKVEINTAKEKNEVLLYLDTAYELTPQITTKDEYKGVILKNITAQPQNKRVSGSLLTEIQVFNINSDLYVLGVGDSTQIHIEVSRAGQTFKITFLKAQPSHLELLMNKSLNLPVSSPLDSGISSDIANLPKPDSANFTNTAQSSPMDNNTPPTKADTPTNAQESPQPLPLKSGDLDLWRYAALVGIMVLLIVILLWTRNSLRKNTKPFASYLAPNSPNGTHFELNPFDPTIKIIAQKRVDSKNKILTIETNGYRYVVLVGNSNTLLDRYAIHHEHKTQQHFLHNNLIIEDSQFTNLLEQKAQRLQRLKNDQNI
ncbi:MAG TPA: hypothetical protein IAA33_04835 [Candidatus Helicobacter avicola]|nr:hypothetical protein [Candidatus Helicobacter avicola]